MLEFIICKILIWYWQYWHARFESNLNLKSDLNQTFHPSFCDAVVLLFKSNDSSEVLYHSWCLSSQNSVLMLNITATGEIKCPGKLK